METDVHANQPTFDKLLAFLTSSRGFDLTTYKRPTLQRRIHKRMQAVGAQGYSDYADYLEVHPDEFKNLFNTILINVTSFFRDEDAWSYLRSEVVRPLVEKTESHVPIRVWVAGCASGEEAYSIAILLAEQLGPARFRQFVKIYATDLDDEALDASRAASYPAESLRAIPTHLAEKYFEKAGNRYVFDRELRRCVIFGQHDLAKDAPISRVDLLMCRNTLMYFNAESKERILERFHFALNDGGFLFLGKAETLLTHANLFRPLDLKNRVFVRVSRGRVRERLPYPASADSDGRRSESNGNAKLRDAAFEHSPVAQIVVDAAGRMSFANDRARTMFSLGTNDIGRPFHDLEVSYRPVELRSGIEQAILQRRIILHKDIQWITLGGEAIVLDVRIIPLSPDSSEPQGIGITFEDVTLYKRLQSELLNFNQELETAYEEVQSTNEELQSTMEELETTNEELQSTNEELATMNEELHSTNEELETINEELRDRSDDLNAAKAFLESILAGLRDGVIVVDAELRILAWNRQSQELWGLRPEEAIGKHLLNLDIGLPVEQLRGPVKACLGTGEGAAITIQSLNRRGKPLECTLTFSPLLAPDGGRGGVIVLAACTCAERLEED